MHEFEQSEDIGVVAGYFGGWSRIGLMRIVDAFLSFPSIFLMLTLAAFLKPSPTMITLIIAVTSWMEVARIVEAEVRGQSSRDFTALPDDFTICAYMTCSSCGSVWGLPLHRI